MLEWARAKISAALYQQTDDIPIPIVEVSSAQNPAQAEAGACWMSPMTPSGCATPIRGHTAPPQ